MLRSCNNAIAVNSLYTRIFQWGSDIAISYVGRDVVMPQRCLYSHWRRSPRLSVYRNLSYCAQLRNDYES